MAFHEFSYDGLDWMIEEGGSVTTHSGAPIDTLPGPFDQTEAIIDAAQHAHGIRSAVQHNGLKPATTTCKTYHAEASEVPWWKFTDGGGCPNKWVLREGGEGQPTGFQTGNYAEVGDAASVMKPRCRMRWMARMQHSLSSTKNVFGRSRKRGCRGRRRLGRGPMICTGAAVMRHRGVRYRATIRSIMPRAASARRFWRRFRARRSTTCTAAQRAVEFLAPAARLEHQATCTNRQLKRAFEQRQAWADIEERAMSLNHREGAPQGIGMPGNSFRIKLARRFVACIYRAAGLRERGNLHDVREVPQDQGCRYIM